MCVCVCVCVLVSECRSESVCVDETYSTRVNEGLSHNNECIVGTDNATTKLDQTLHNGKEAPNSVLRNLVATHYSLLWFDYVSG